MSKASERRAARRQARADRKQAKWDAKLARQGQRQEAKSATKMAAYKAGIDPSAKWTGVLDTALSVGGDVIKTKIMKPNTPGQGGKNNTPADPGNGGGGGGNSTAMLAAAAAAAYFLLKK